MGMAAGVGRWSLPRLQRQKEGRRLMQGRRMRGELRDGVCGPRGRAGAGMVLEGVPGQTRSLPPLLTGSPGLALGPSLSLSGNPFLIASPQPGCGTGFPRECQSRPHPAQAGQQGSVRPRPSGSPGAWVSRLSAFVSASRPGQNLPGCGDPCERPMPPALLRVARPLAGLAQPSLPSHTSAWLPWTCSGN